MLPKSIKFKPIGTPNYILLQKEMDSGLCSVILADIDAESLSKLCDAWRKEVFKKAKQVDPKL